MKTVHPAKLNFKNILLPVKPLLNLVSREMLQIVDSNGCLNKFEKNLIKNIFRLPSKKLRPSLLLLSANAAGCMTDEIRSAVIRNAAVIEMIHNASLIHDDVIDESGIRRNEQTLNFRYGSKLAVLIGDIVNTCAFNVLNGNPGKEINGLIMDCIFTMCRGEIFSYNKKSPGRKDYLKIIHDKTACLMSVSCKTGAMLACTDKSVINELGEFGLNFGYAFQLIDDINDGDTPAAVDGSTCINDASDFIAAAVNNLKAVPENKYTMSMKLLCEYILNDRLSGRNEKIKTP
ncbi:MAG: polyprenyl synthetase family protein [Spirochaetes bacterium]|nr:polyprenyl synthetase family protein [Spirochaetota bacterium]